MSSETVVALYSLVGTLIGSLGGIVMSNRLTNHRLEQLEKKMDRHNNFGERLAAMERDVQTLFRLIEQK